MARTMSKISLILIPLLCLGSSTEAKNWRYWPNIGCFEFSFERTVFFELTNEATRLSTIEGSELPAIVNTSIVPSSDNELQLQHILAGSIRNSSTNTPEECITACNATGFAYAGLQDGKRCVCTNEAPTAQTDGSNCNTGCPGNGSYSCGGSWTMDLHQNPAYHSSQLTYFGCFKNTFNDLDRMLFEGTYNNFRNNTPDWCVAYCTTGGFDYAGLQYGSQCICTNSGPQGTSDAGQCTYGCAGDSSIKMCGGLGYINIFHTDAHKTTIDDWGCGNTVQDTYYQKWYNDMGHCGVVPSSGGGGNGNSGGTTEKGSILLVISRGFEFLSLDENKPLPSCIAGKGQSGGLDAYPAQGVNLEGKPFYCESRYTKKRCFTYYVQNDTYSGGWVQTGELPEYMEQFTWAFDPAVGVVVAGGNNDGGRGANLDSVYRTKDGVTFDTLPTLYERIEAGCMAIIDDDEVLHFGGRDPQHQVLKRTSSYKFSTNEWTRKADMTDGGQQIACNMVKHQDGDREIIVTGQKNDRVEIYNIATDTWRMGNPFPQKQVLWANGNHVRYGDTLLAIGGFDYDMTDERGSGGRDERELDTIYEYNVNNDTWTLLPQRISSERLQNMYWMTGQILGDDICN